MGQQESTTWWFSTCMQCSAGISRWRKASRYCLGAETRLLPPLLSQGSSGVSSQTCYLYVHHVSWLGRASLGLLFPLIQDGSLVPKFVLHFTTFDRIYKGPSFLLQVFLQRPCPLQQQIWRLRISRPAQFSSLTLLDTGQSGDGHGLLTSVCLRSQDFSILSKH